jgi:hypothetical protein
MGKSHMYQGITGKLKIQFVFSLPIMTPAAGFVASVGLVPIPVKLTDFLLWSLQIGLWNCGFASPNFQGCMNG